jgi:hypothetical protein
MLGASAARTIVFLIMVIPLIGCGNRGQMARPRGADLT